MADWFDVFDGTATCFTAANLDAMTDFIEHDAVVEFRIWDTVAKGTEHFSFTEHTIDFNTDRAIYINDDETYIGHGAGDNITPGSGTNNTLIGHDAGNATTTGDNNVVVGYGAFILNTTGFNNVVVGASAFVANTTGERNTIIGAAAAGGATGVDLDYCVLIGYNAGNANTADGAVAVGYGALQANTGAGNTAVGYLAMDANTSGYSNVALGYDSLGANTTGYYNVAIGRWSIGDNTTGIENTAIGTSAGGNATATINGCVYLGYEAGANNATANTLHINNSDSAFPLIWGDFANHIVTFNNGTAQMFKMERSGDDNILTGGSAANDDFYIVCNSSDNIPWIHMFGGGAMELNVIDEIRFDKDETLMFKMEYVGGNSYLKGAEDPGNMYIRCNQAGTPTIMMASDDYITLDSNTDIYFKEQGMQMFKFALENAGGAMHIAQATDAPTPIADSGCIFVEDDNTLRYIDPDGTEYTVDLTPV